MSKFQIIILAIFVVFLVGGVIAFATFKGTVSNKELPAITIWGTFPEETFISYVSSINTTLAQPLKISYTYVRPENFSSTFVSSLARGVGPDAILIQADSLMPHEDKLVPIPYSALSQRTFMDSYVQEGNIYLSSYGVLGLPFTIDPLIMYWNRDMFDAAGIATHPQTWDEFAMLNKKLTVKDDKGTIKKSAVALGDFSTVSNAREILATLIFQSGNPITLRDQDGLPVSVLRGNNSASSPASAVEFFARAVDATDAAYSWNRSMPESKTAFLSGILATYFGFTSELGDLRLKNPNINFDAALLPQPKNGGQRATYARMHGFSIVRTSVDPSSTYQILSILTAPQNLRQLSETMYLPSVRRDVIGQGSSDAYISIFNQAALISKTWIDIDPTVSRSLFRTLVETITSGRRTTEQALQEIDDQYNVFLGDVRK